MLAHNPKATFEDYVDMDWNDLRQTAERAAIQIKKYTEQTAVLPQNPKRKHDDSDGASGGAPKGRGRGNQPKGGRGRGRGGKGNPGRGRGRGANATNQQHAAALTGNQQNKRKQPDDGLSRYGWANTEDRMRQAQRDGLCFDCGDAGHKMNSPQCPEKTRCQEWRKKQKLDSAQQTLTLSAPELQRAMTVVTNSLSRDLARQVQTMSLQSSASSTPPNTTAAAASSSGGSGTPNGQ